jgi:hypothetical protein
MNKRKKMTFFIKYWLALVNLGRTGFSNTVAGRRSLLYVSKTGDGTPL